MKPDIITEIERQLGQPLHMLKNMTDPLDGVRHEYNLSYMLDGERLVGLNVSGSELLTSLSFDHEVCASLGYLNLNGNRKLERVRFAAPLPALRYLDLSGCSLNRLTLPTGCNHLVKAWLQNNKLTQMTFSGTCPSLELLDLSRNKLKELILPFGFEALANLYAVGNGLVDLEFTQTSDERVVCENFRWHSPLPRLETLHLAENSLEQVPENIIFSEKLSALYLGGNVPKNIPKIFLGEHSNDFFHNLFLGEDANFSSHNCLEDARIWFSEIRERPHEPNRTVKLMLLGNGNVGKSTLACALANGRCEHAPDHHKSTHGILLQTQKKGNFIYNIWDLGGQEVYHGTHWLFVLSEALQVIVFDRETEEKARNHQVERDPVREEELVRPQPIPYWYEITSELTRGSRFLLIQNTKRDGERDDESAREYAKVHGVDFLRLNAKTGDNMQPLLALLSRLAGMLPGYGMTMPESWLKVRRFFIDNLEKRNSQKILLKTEFDQLCADCRVMDASRELLLRYLYHNGFVYYHENLGDRIIADLKWALHAIYKPYDRYAPHYQEFIDLHGKIRVSKLFEVFGDDYEEKEKWLFLEFMQGCGLCFQLNDKPWREKKGLGDIYVFPKFLPDATPVDVERFWAANAKDSLVLRYRLPWLNYYLVQFFIVALGRKTASDNFWRYGIHVSTPEGWFKVELDYCQKALLVHIERQAATTWLLPIFKELQIGSEGQGWEISFTGREFGNFDINEWLREGKNHFSERITVAGEGKSQKLLHNLTDTHQEVDREVVLLLAANPTTDILSFRYEHSQIAEKLVDRRIRGKIELIPHFGISPDRMIDTIMEEQPTIIHFIGHGFKGKPITGLGGGIVMHSDDFQDREVVSAESLEKIFARLKKNVPRLEIVFLSACYSEPQAIAISRNNMYAIGANDELSSKAARKFASGFYYKYGLCGNVKDAIDYGMMVSLSSDENIENLIHLYYNGAIVPVEPQGKLRGGI